MKNLLLVKNRIFAYFLRNKLIFTLFVLGGILNAFVLASFFGEAQTVLKLVSQPENLPQYRTYSLVWWQSAHQENMYGDGNNELSEAVSYDLSTPEVADKYSPVTGLPIDEQERHLTWKQAKLLTESSDIETVAVRWSQFVMLDHGDGFLAPARISDFCAVLKGEPQTLEGIPMEFSRGNLLYSELRDDQIIMNSSSKAQVGDTVFVGDMEFEVVAVLRNYVYYYDTNIITPAAMEKLSGGLLNSIKIQSIHPYERNSDPVVSLVHQVFTDYDIVYLDQKFPYGTSFGPGYYFTRAPLYEETPLSQPNMMEYYTRLGQILFCYFASQMAFLILLWHLLESMGEENAISVIVGMKRSRGAILIFFESLLLTFIPGLLGLVLHYFLTPFIFTHINSVYFMVSTFKGYFNLILMMLGIQLLVLLPFVLIFILKNPIGLRRKSL